MNVDHGQMYDLSIAEQRAAFEADDRAVPVSDQVAADQMRGRLARLERDMEDKLQAHFARQDRISNG